MDWNKVAECPWYKDGMCVFDPPHLVRAGETSGIKGGKILSSVNRNGKGNLLISYLFKSEDIIDQIREERALKNELVKLMSSKGYKFVIADDELIDEKLIED